jgi:UDP-glucose 4-epimerase
MGTPPSRHSLEQKSNLKQRFLAWVFASRKRTKASMAALHLFRLGKIPGIRDVFPWTNPARTKMYYLPVNQSLEVENTVLPRQILHYFIDKSPYHVLMNFCGCRKANQCEHFPDSIGCLFMGQSALEIPPGVSRRVTAEEAHAHVEKAAALGLVPLVGKVRVDNFIFLIPDRRKLLSVCFCCHCCCMMRSFGQVAPDHLDQLITPLEGIHIAVSTACTGCGRCIEFCPFKAISIENGQAVHSDYCRSCGRCERYCPNHAVSISFDAGGFPESEIQELQHYVSIR